MSDIDWIAVDWGTSSLRAWAMSGESAVDRRQSKDGMGTLSREGFGPALEALCEGWPADVPAVACGMVGARQGWVEAPYAALPCPPLSFPFARAPGDRPVHIVPGLRQSAPPDVMRGEETQIAGWLALNPGWDGVLCLPGTHTKWAEVSAGEVISFRTFMSGEMFALLAGQSVLRHSVAEGWDAEAFAEAVNDVMTRPEDLAARLFRIRADHLLNGTDPEVAYSRLSGLLIGAELAAAKPWWLGREVAVIGDHRIAAAYITALGAQGVPATEADTDAMTLKGLTAARALIGEPL